MKMAIPVLILVAVSFLASAYFYPLMPEQMASHWNARGEVDGYMPRFWGTFLMPLVALGLAGLFAILPKIDPLKRNYPAFRKYYNCVIFFVIALLLYVHGISMAANLGFSLNMSYLVLGPIALMFILLGFVMPKIKRNWFMGIRTPWTLSSDNVWKKTHRVGGKLFMACGFFFLATLLFPGLIVDYFLWVILLPIMTLVGITLVYSYYEYRKEEKKR